MKPEEICELANQAKAGDLKAIDKFHTETFRWSAAAYFKMPNDTREATGRSLAGAIDAWAAFEPKPKCREEDLADWFQECQSGDMQKMSEAAAILRKVAAVREACDGYSLNRMADNCVDEGNKNRATILRAVAALLETKE